MTKDDVEQILQPIHAMEQRTGQMVARKALGMLLPGGMSYADKRYVIRAWQDSYFARFRNVMKYSSKKALVDSVLGKRNIVTSDS